jgi:hypothetical protein
MTSEIVLLCNKALAINDLQDPMEYGCFIKSAQSLKDIINVF